MPSIEGPQQGPEPLKLSPELAKPKTGQEPKTDQVMFSGIKTVLNMMNDWAEQLEQNLSAATSRAALPTALEEPSTAERAEGTRRASEMGAAKREPINRSQYGNVNYLLENVGQFVSKIEIIASASKGLASLDYNKDPDTLMKEVSGKLQSLFTSAKELKEVKKQFESSADAFPQIENDKETIDQAYTELFSSSGPLEELGKVKDQVEQFTQGKHPSAGNPAAVGHLLRTVHDASKKFDGVVRSSGGILKAAKGALASAANKIANLVQMGRMMKKAEAGTPEMQSPSASNATAGTVEGTAATTPPSESVWGNLQKVLLGDILPELYKEAAEWGYLVALEGVLVEDSSKLAKYLAKITATKINQPGVNQKTELSALHHELTDYVPKMLDVLKSMEGQIKKFSSEMRQKFGTPKQWNPGVEKALQGFESAISDVYAAVSKLEKNGPGDVSYMEKHVHGKNVGGTGTKVKMSYYMTDCTKQQAGLRSMLQAVQQQVKSLGADIAQQGSTIQEMIGLDYIQIKAAFSCFTQIESSLVQTANSVTSNLKT